MKISVVMPAYNSEATIKPSIDSVLSQSGAELELIVINDGSTDKTAEILEGYGERLDVRSIPNGGVANARNLALELASGDYVMFVDSDDVLLDGAILHIAETISRTDADIIRFEYMITSDGGAPYPPEDRFTEDEFIPKEAFRERIYPHFINGIRLNSMCLTATRRRLFEGLSIRKDMKTAEDAYLMTDVYTRAQSVQVIAKPLYIYQRHIDSLTGSGLRLASKYMCNIKLGLKIASLLPAWHMTSPKWYFKTFMRPVFLTFDKIRRINKGRAS